MLAPEGMLRKNVRKLLGEKEKKVEDTVEFEVKEREVVREVAVGKSTYKYTILPMSNEPYKDEKKFLENVEEDIKRVVSRFNTLIKEEIVLNYHVRMEDEKTEITKFNIAHARTGFIRLDNGTEYDNDLHSDIKNDILQQISKFVNKGSGWQFDYIKNPDLIIVEYQPIHVNGNTLNSHQRLTVKKPSST